MLCRHLHDSLYSETHVWEDEDQQNRSSIGITVSEQMPPQGKLTRYEDFEA